MSSRTRRSGFITAVMIAAGLFLHPGEGRTGGFAGSSPGLTTCEFPDAVPATAAPVPVTVVLTGESGPVAGATVTVSILVDAGALDPVQPRSASAVTDASGTAVPTFDHGIWGAATIRLRTSWNGTVLCTSAPLEVTAGPKFAFHVQESMPSACSSAPGGPCLGYATRATTGHAYVVYLVVAQADPARGVSGMSCGLDYDSHPRSGVDVTGWDLCADGLGFTLPGPNGDWPAAGSAIRIAWSQCDDRTVAGYEDQGVNAVAGALYLYAWSENILSVTPNGLIPGSPPELLFGDCEGREVPVSPSNLGSVAFSGDGSLAGSNPCDEHVEFPPPPPPLPPPPPPRPKKNRASIVLHIGGMVSPTQGCAAAPQHPADVVTAAPASLDGSDEYFVYLMCTPAGGDSGGFRGMQVGIRYDEDSPGRRGLAVHSWHACSDLDFSQDEWPAPESGTTLTWVDCRRESLVVGGYLDVTAYAPSIMAIAPFNATGVVKVANCGGAELTIDLNQNSAQVGWISLGGASLGTDSDGCNPAMEDCVRPTAVRPVTWGKLKTIYRSGN
jgi:hypothetical protein